MEPKRSRVAVIGCGYLGAVHAAAMAHWGHPTIGVDTSQRQVDALNAGEAPFLEPGLDQLLREGSTAGLLSFTTDMAALAGCDVAFLCVGTPQLDGCAAADLSQLDQAVQTVAAHMRPGSLLIGKSTVPVGTAARVAEQLAAAGIRVAWNPEFLREATAVRDTLEPDRLVFGVTAGGDEAELRDLYREPIAAGSAVVVTDLPSAEVTKQTANAFLATKISFINAVAELCDAAGADVTDVARALGLDERIGARFLGAGLGYGGGCFPKDVRALAHRSRELGADTLARMLELTDEANLHARRRGLDLVLRHLPPSSASKVAVLGATFKPGSDDLRDSPAVWLVEQLTAVRPVRVGWHDPSRRGGSVLRDRLLCATAAAAAAGADVTVIATDWSEYVTLDPATLPVRSKLLIDLRNCVDTARWENAGWTVHAPGRSAAGR